ncbi:MAG: hypothetical protein ACKOPI_06210, partial [bacterium]
LAENPRSGTSRTGSASIFGLGSSPDRLQQAAGDQSMGSGPDDQGPEEPSMEAQERGAGGGCQLGLAGEDRFSRYRLGFSLEPTGTGQTQLAADTSAAFPDLHGRLFRTLVLGSGAHALVTRRLLKTIGRAAETEDRG